MNVVDACVERTSRTILTVSAAGPHKSSPLPLNPNQDEDKRTGRNNTLPAFLPLGANTVHVISSEAIGHPLRGFLRSPAECRFFTNLGFRTRWLACSRVFFPGTVSSLLCQMPGIQAARYCVLFPFLKNIQINAERCRAVDRYWRLLSASRVGQAGQSLTRHSASSFADPTVSKGAIT